MKDFIVQGVQNLYKAQTDRFFQNRLRDNEEELADIQAKLDELVDRKIVLEGSIAFCKSRLNIT
jgi:hypothetical protein